MKFLIKLGQIILFSLFALALGFLFSLFFEFWSDYAYWPDTLHFYLHSDYVFRFFPNFDWHYLWGCGGPFLFHYPKPLFLLNAGLRLLTGWDMQAIAFGAIFGGIFLAVVWTALAIKIATGSWLLSLASPFFFYGSTMLWQNKNPARGATYHLLALATLSLVWYWQKPGRQRKIILILCLAACSLFHPIIGLLVLATTGCFLLKSLKKLFSVMIPVILIASSYYLPLKVLSGAHVRFFPIAYEHTDSLSHTLKSLAYLGISPFIFPLALFVLVISILFARKNLSSYHKTLLLGAVLTSLGLLVYVFGVFFNLPPAFYITGLPHSVMSLYLPPFLALITAIGIKALTKNRPRALLWLIGGLLFSGMLYVNLLPFKDKTITFNPKKPLYETIDLTSLKELFGPPPGEIDHHYIGYYPPDFIADFFNLYYDAPNFGQAPSRGLGGKWHYKTMQALIQPGQEKFFYLDWFGIHYLFHFYDLPADLVENPEVFTIKTYDQEGNPYGGYLNNSKPILEASLSPSVLLISKDSVYDDWIETLSWANINSSFLIPVKGPETLSQISQKELNKFDVVWFYNYQYDSKKSELEKLTRFVKQGGGLVVDTGFGPDMEGTNLPDPFPVFRTYTAPIKENWQVKTTTHPISEGINFTRFSPPLYEDGGQEYAWKISTVDSIAIKSWAKSVLTTQDKTIIVAGQLGEGRVVWTGFNLLYHLSRYKNNQAESLLIKNMALWAAKNSQETPVQFTAQFINPEKREIEVNSSARGIILRQQFFQNWKVKLDLKRQKIYQAGPHLIYLPLAKDQTYPAKVVFYYRKSLIETGTTALAVATGLILIIAFFKKDFPDRYFASFNQSLKKRYKKITEEE